MNLIANNNTKVWEILQRINDPEIPVLSIIDLGIVREVTFNEETTIITITPTYSGCPAMDIIALQIKLQLIANGYKNVQIKQQLFPAWTTDWITPKGKQALQQYGIAPPNFKAGTFVTEGLVCPNCKSTNTEMISEFGSTACKALFKCNDCKEPFDYFKCH
jgi:ring-1,2-phenylacetyl-CoA epoxidase subunit PaaD